MVEDIGEEWEGDLCEGVEWGWEGEGDGSSFESGV